MDTPDRFFVSGDLLLTPDVHPQKSDVIETPNTFTPKTPSLDIGHISPNSSTRHQRRLDNVARHHHSQLERHKSRMETGLNYCDFPCLKAMEVPGIHPTHKSKKSRNFNPDCKQEISTLGFNDILLNLELNLPKQETQLDIQNFLINNPNPSINELLQFSDELPTDPGNVQLKNGQKKESQPIVEKDNVIVTRTLPYYKDDHPVKVTKTSNTLPTLTKLSNTLPKNREPVTVTSIAVHQQTIPSVQSQNKFSNEVPGKNSMFGIQQNNLQFIPLVKSQDRSSSLAPGKGPMFRLQPGPQPTYKSIKSSTVTSSSLSSLAKNQEQNRMANSQNVKRRPVHQRETWDQMRLKEIGSELNNNKQIVQSSTPQISRNIIAEPKGPIKTATTSQPSNSFTHDKNQNVLPNNSFPNSYIANQHNPQKIQHPRTTNYQQQSLKNTETINHSKQTFSNQTETNPNQTQTLNHSKPPFSNQTENINHSKQTLSNQTENINHSKQTLSNQTANINHSNQTQSMNHPKQTLPNHTQTTNHSKQTLSNQTETINYPKQTLSNQTQHINHPKQTLSNQTQIPSFQHMRPQTSSYFYPTVPSYHPYRYAYNQNCASASPYNMYNYSHQYQTDNGYYSSYYQKQDQGFYGRNYTNAYFNPYQQYNHSTFYPNMQATNARQASQVAQQLIYSSGNIVKKMKLSEAPTQVNKVSSSYFGCEKNKMKTIAQPVKHNSNEEQILPNSNESTNVKNGPQISVQNEEATKEKLPNIGKPENHMEIIKDKTVTSSSKDSTKTGSHSIISGSSITENCSKCKNLKSRIDSIQRNDTVVTIQDTDDESSEENVIVENNFGILCDDCGGVILEEEEAHSEANIEHSNISIDKDNTQNIEAKSWEDQNPSLPKPVLDVDLTNNKSNKESLVHSPSNEVSMFKSSASSPKHSLKSTCSSSENKKFVPQNKRSIITPPPPEESEDVEFDEFESNRRDRAGYVLRGRSKVGTRARSCTKSNKERKCWNCNVTQSSAWYTHRRQPSNHLCDACYHYYKQRNEQDRKLKTRQPPSGEMQIIDKSPSNVKPDTSEVPVFLPQAKLRNQPVERTDIDAQIASSLNMDSSSTNDLALFGDLFDLDIGFIDDIVDIKDTNKDALSYQIVESFGLGNDLEFLQNIDCSSPIDPGVLKIPPKASKSLSKATQRKKSSKVPKRKVKSKVSNTGIVTVKQDSKFNVVDVCGTEDTPTFSFSFTLPDQ